jgi:hypothetical protein
VLEDELLELLELLELEEAGVLETPLHSLLLAVGSLLLGMELTDSEPVAVPAPGAFALALANAASMAPLFFCSCLATFSCTCCLFSVNCWVSLEGGSSGAVPFLALAGVWALVFFGAPWDGSVALS